MKREINEPAPLNNVHDFHELFDLPVRSNPVIPDQKRCELRISLLEEELEELKTAIEQKDLVEMADALCDLQYVLSGAILEFGMGHAFKALFEEVQRSNMSKACSTMQEAKETCEWYATHKNTEAFIQPKGDKFLVYRVGDKKVLKSVNYSPADLKKLL